MDAPAFKISDAVEATSSAGTRLCSPPQLSILHSLYISGILPLLLKRTSHPKILLSREGRLADTFATAEECRAHSSQLHNSGFWVLGAEYLIRISLFCQRGRREDEERKVEYLPWAILQRDYMRYFDSKIINKASWRGGEERGGGILTHWRQRG